MLIKDKVAIVTGSAQGLGKAFAEAILKRKGKVCLCDIEEDVGQKTLEEFQQKYGDERVVFRKIDLVNRAEQEELFKFVKKHFGGINILCNNAGVFDSTCDEYVRMVDINLTAMITGSFLAIDHFKEAGEGGVIVNIASVGGALEFMADHPVYCGTKHGVLGFSNSLAINDTVKENNIRVNIICPTYVRTRMVTSIQDEDYQKFVKDFGILEPEFVAQGFIELVEDEAKNGAVQVITPDEGIHYKEL